jgi:hypothetical protein
LGNWIQGNGAYSDEQVALNRFEERYPLNEAILL